MWLRNGGKNPKPIRRPKQLASSSYKLGPVSQFSALHSSDISFLRPLDDTNIQGENRVMSNPWSESKLLLTESQRQYENQPRHLKRAQLKAQTLDIGQKAQSVILLPHHLDVKVPDKNNNVFVENEDSGSYQWQPSPSPSIPTTSLRENQSFFEDYTWYAFVAHEMMSLFQRSFMPYSSKTLLFDYIVFLNSSLLLFAICLLTPKRSLRMLCYCFKDKFGTTRRYKKCKSTVSRSNMIGTTTSLSNHKSPPSHYNSNSPNSAFRNASSLYSVINQKNNVNQSFLLNSSTNSSENGYVVNLSLPRYESNNRRSESESVSKRLAPSPSRRTQSSQLQSSVAQSTERVRRRREHLHYEREKLLNRSKSLSPRSLPQTNRTKEGNASTKGMQLSESSPVTRMDRSSRLGVVAERVSRKSNNDQLSKTITRSASLSPVRSEGPQSHLIHALTTEHSETNLEKTSFHRGTIKNDDNEVNISIDLDGDVHLMDESTLQYSINQSRSNDPEDSLPQWFGEELQSRRYVSSPSSTSKTTEFSNPDVSGVIPSPSHPSSTHQVPANHIVLETMKRLQSRGVRLLAHGIHVVEPKRVWLRYNIDQQALEWQSESTRQIKSNPGNDDAAHGKRAEIILVRGVLHSIPIANILYVDLGLKTMAFLAPKRTKANFLPSAMCCFSLLTNEGSLDLQTNSKLERDALVSCLCWILDYYCQEKRIPADAIGNWRYLYAESKPGESSDNVSNSSISGMLQQERQHSVNMAMSLQIFNQLFGGQEKRHLNRIPVSSQASERDARRPDIP